MRRERSLGLSTPPIVNVVPTRARISDLRVHGQVLLAFVRRAQPALLGPIAVAACMPVSPSKYY